MTEFATVCYYRNRVKVEWKFHKAGQLVDPEVIVSWLIYSFRGQPVLKFKEMGAMTNELIGKMAEEEAMNVNDLLQQVMQELMPETRFIILGVSPYKKRKTS